MRNPLQCFTNTGAIVCLIYSLAGTNLVSASQSEAEADDPHKHHRQMMQSNKAYTRTEVNYAIPDLALRNQHGDKVSSKSLLDQDSPLIVSYIFTTCATICPVLTATIASAQDELINSEKSPQIISISIDPEEDTPDRLAEYADKFKASSKWIFLTGSLEDITRVQRAMNVYRGSKLNHEPVTFIKPARNSPWIRIDGFTSAADLVKEYRAAIAAL